MKLWLIAILLITLNPVPVHHCQPLRTIRSCSPGITTTATAYCLKGHTTSGPRTTAIHGHNGYGCIALSRKLAKDLGLKCGPGQYDYKFGSIIELEGHGLFIFGDLMPTMWRGYRVDVYRPTLKECRVFGVQRRQIRVVKKKYRKEISTCLK